MASDSKAAGGIVTKEVESRIKQSPEHLFEVFLEIREPVENETPEILLKYPQNYPDEQLKTVPNFAYPCKIPSDEQGEHFAFVILDITGTLFRFGYCRRSNRESTCLCIISFYPWFETFYKILDDLSSIINSKSTVEMEQFLSALYNYKLMPLEEFHKREGKETIEINIQSKNYSYNRPDSRKLPSILSSRNFSVMVSRLSPELMLNLFSHLLFERRILFVSSKLFHLTACAYGCLNLIYPMHWQSIFLPILPSIMTWTVQCTAPYIIGMHTSLYSTLKLDELGDVVTVKIDERKIESPYDDLDLFPKYLVRSMKKGIEQSSQLAGDHLARVFLRAMAFSIGSYAHGFDIKNNILDFDRDRYLEPYLGSHRYGFMSAVAHTQMFEQFSRYKTHAQLQRETDVDEFELEVKNLQKLQQSKKFKTNKKIYKLIEKATNPLIEQVQTRAEKLQTAINKAGQRVASEASSVRNNLTSFDINDVIKRANTTKTHQSITTNNVRELKEIHQSSTPDLLNDNAIPYEKLYSKDNLFSSQPRLINQDRVETSSSSSSNSSTPELQRAKTNQLINLDFDDEDPLLPTPIVLNVINTSSATPPIQRQTPQIDSKIRQLQAELQYKVQTFDGKRIDPRGEYGEQQKEIRKLVEQFDPFDDPAYSNHQKKPMPDIFDSSPIGLRTDQFSSNTQERHPSIYQTIPSNYVSSVLHNIQTTFGTPNRLNNPRPAYSTENKLLQPTSTNFPPLLPTRAKLFPSNTYPSLSEDLESNFDPLLSPSSNKKPSNENTPSSSETPESNLIDFN